MCREMHHWGRVGEGTTKCRGGCTKSGMKDTHDANRHWICDFMTERRPAEGCFGWFRLHWTINPRQASTAAGVWSNPSSAILCSVKHYPTIPESLQRTFMQFPAGE